VSVDAVRIVYGAGSDVTVGRPSVCLSHQSTAAGGFAAERPAGTIDRLLRPV